jgi:hypothetical protein
VEATLVLGHFRLREVRSAVHLDGRWVDSRQDRRLAVGWDVGQLELGRLVLVGVDEGHRFVLARRREIIISAD